MADSKVVEKKLNLPAEFSTTATNNKAELLEQIGKILKDYDNLESNIPPSHDYWNLLNHYRAS